MTSEQPQAYTGVEHRDPEMARFRNWIRRHQGQYQTDREQEAWIQGVRDTLREVGHALGVEEIAA